MEFTYLVTRDEILQRTPIGGNTDQDKVAPHIVTSQDIEVQSVLGSNLYKKIKEDFKTDSLTEPYLSLLNEYIKPMLCHYVASNFYFFHAFTVANGGIYKHQSENSFTPPLSEINLLCQQQKALANHYRYRLIDYLCHESSLFPEYLTTSGAGMTPDRGTRDNQIVF